MQHIPTSVQLRPAERTDCQQIFEWRNDDWIVSLGSLNSTVTWEEHSAWLNRVLEDPERLLYIIVSPDQEDMGTFRIEKLNDTTAVLSLYLMKDFNGKGYGTSAIKIGTQLAFSVWSELQTVEAHILPTNERSKYVFEKIGFTAQPTLSEDGEWIMRLHRPSDVE